MLIFFIVIIQIYSALLFQTVHLPFNKPCAKRRNTYISFPLLTFLLTKSRIIFPTPTSK